MKLLLVILLAIFVVAECTGGQGGGSGSHSKSGSHGSKSGSHGSKSGSHGSKSGSHGSGSKHKYHDSHSGMKKKFRGAKKHKIGQHSSSSDSHGSHKHRSDTKDTYRSSSSDSSSGFGFWNRGHQFQFRPMNCEPCELLTNARSEYFKKCGRHLNPTKRSQYLQRCKNAGNNANAIKALFREIKGFCYKQSAILFEFRCLPLKMLPNQPYRTCKDGTVLHWSQSCLDEIYFPEPEKCDKCDAFQVGTVFYEECGKYMGPMLAIYEARCRSRCDDWEVQESAIVGFCFCKNPNWMPDFCGRVPTTPEPTTEPPNNECDVNGDIIPFGSVDIVVNDCTKLCSCLVANQASCTEYACDVNADCVLSSENLQICECIEGYEGDGLECFEKPKVCETKELDVIFVMDVSDSISSGDSAISKMFMKIFLAALDFETTNVGGISFSDAAELMFPLGPVSQLQDLLDEIDQLPSPSGLTYTNLAIKKVIEQLIANARPTAKPIVVIMTDGKSTKECKTVEEMKRFNDLYGQAVTLAFGVGDDVYLGELSVLAKGSQETNMYEQGSYADILDIVIDLVKDACTANNDPDQKSLLMRPADCTGWSDDGIFGVYDFYPAGEVSEVECYVNLNFYNTYGGNENIYPPYFHHIIFNADTDRYENIKSTELPPPPDDNVVYEVVAYKSKNSGNGYLGTWTLVSGGTAEAVGFDNHP